MLTFRNTNSFFIVLLLLLVSYDALNYLPFFIYPVIVIIYSLILFWGCYYVGSNFFVRVICSADITLKQIAISFDDGPAEAYTPDVLKILREKQVAAAFFCIGNRINGNELLLQQIHQEGHVIGNHSYSHHFWFDMYPASKMTADLKLMDVEVKAVTGLTPRLFRPPYGVTNPAVKQSILNGNYIPVGWNVRSMDTVTKDEHKLLSKINRSLKPGAVFLFHDTSKTMLNVLPQFIDHARQSGYELVRLDKLLNLQPYA